jgi:formylglycine-generating enzyme required for sulfatase activity
MIIRGQFSVLRSRKLFALTLFFSALFAVAASCAPATPAQVISPAAIPSTAPSLAGLGSTKLSPADNVTMVYVPAGQFPMGSKVGLIDEQPVHMVQLDSFWLDRTEVTNEMYRKCVEAGSCKEPGSRVYYDDPQYSDHPVVFVAWTNAVSYCSFAGRRLPTEAEWEKAAAWNPVQNEKRIFPWGNEYDCSKGNFDDETKLDASLMQGGSISCDGYDLTAPVGSYPQGASPYGALDMGGNVWEWVHDAFIEVNSFDSSIQNYYAFSRFENPMGVSPALTTSRGIRGGSWNWTYGYGRSAYRLGFGKNDTYDAVGFRCAVSSTFHVSDSIQKRR